MLFVNIPLLALALALGASATPTPSLENLVVARDAASGTNAGTIFAFGDDEAARKTLYTGGSCGLSTYFADQVKPTDHLVAMPQIVMAKYGASQHNKLCGKRVTMTSKGKTQMALVADTNVSPENSIDMTSAVWTAFGMKDGDGSHVGFEIQWSVDM
jgi:hypothetical protein